MTWPLVLFVILFFVTISLFVTYVIIDRQQYDIIQKTIQEAPLVVNAIPDLQAVHERRVASGGEEPDLAGLIVEARDHPNLFPVIDNFRKCLPGVDVYVFHGLTNGPKLRERYGESPTGMHLVQIESDNLTIRQYNYLLTRPELWSNLRARHVLVFQTDSVLFSRSKVDIRDYFQYDYVGAPWRTLYKSYVQNAFMFRALHKHTWAGNGGLSLRRRSTMIDVTLRRPYLSIPYAAEDVYFSNALDDVEGVKLPDRDTASSLFYETIESPELPLGAHKYVPKCHVGEIEPDELSILDVYAGKADHNISDDGVHS